ncbi:MAG: hypothetical protein Q9159_003732 [Coniocarpon cinnabarinum]
MMNMVPDEMARLPPMARDEVSTEKDREFYDFMDAGVKRLTDTSKQPNDPSVAHPESHAKTSTNNPSFTIKDAQGRLLGPCAPLQHTPELGRHILGIQQELGRLPGLPLKAREVAILVVGSNHGAAYEVYAHRRIAMTVGLSEDECDSICLEDKPESLDKMSAMAYDVAHEILECPGPLSDSTWNDGCHVLGKEGMTALVHYVGAYSYLCVVLNGFDCKVPDGETL